RRRCAAQLVEPGGDQLLAELVEEVLRAAAVDGGDLGRGQRHAADEQGTAVRGDQLRDHGRVVLEEALAVHAAGHARYLVGEADVGGTGGDLDDRAALGDVAADQRADTLDGDGGDGDAGRGGLGHHDPAVGDRDRLAAGADGYRDGPGHAGHGELEAARDGSGGARLADLDEAGGWRRGGGRIGERYRGHTGREYAADNGQLE